MLASASYSFDCSRSSACSSSSCESSGGYPASCCPQPSASGAAGFPLQLYVFATLGRHDPRATRIFEDQIRALPQIISADNVAGEMDYLLSVVARDVAELQEVLTRLSTRGGQRLITYLRLSEVKPPCGLPLDPHLTAGGRAARQRRRPPADRREPAS